MKIWTDPKIEPLPPDARYLFLYLITNEHRNESGLYSLTIRTMANETGLSLKRVEAALAQLNDIRRVAYDAVEGVVWVANAARHTPMNENCIKSIEKDLEFCSSPVLRESFCQHYANHLSLQEVTKRFSNGSKTVWNGFIEPTIQGTGYKVQGTGNRVQGKSKQKETRIPLLDTTSEESSSPTFDVLRSFEETWKIYPVKDGKDAAFKHFKKTVKSESDVARVRKALDIYLNSDRVRSGYIKNGSTWFKCWEDWENWTEPAKKGKAEDSPLSSYHFNN